MHGICCVRNAKGCHKTSCTCSSPYCLGKALTGRQVLTVCLDFHTTRDVLINLFSVKKHWVRVRRVQQCALRQLRGAGGGRGGRGRDGGSSLEQPWFLGECTRTEEWVKSSSKYCNPSGSRIRLPPRSRWDNCRNVFYRCWVHFREMLGWGVLEGAGLPIYLPWKS